MLVTPMRAGGTELLAGVTVDPSLGPVLAVGLGGVLGGEVLRDTALRALPAGPAEVWATLGELRGLPLLRGARGTGARRPGRARRGHRPDRRDRVVPWPRPAGPAICSRPSTGTGIEALDVLIVTRALTATPAAVPDKTTDIVRGASHDAGYH